MSRKILLQLFAEPTQTDPTTTEPTQTDPDPTTGKEKMYTDKDVDAIIDKKFAEWKKKQDKAVEEAKKLANMNATQKAEHERDEFKKQLEEYKKKDTLSVMTKEARKMLSDTGISVSDELLSVMVTTDAEQTKAAVDGFATLFKQAVETAVKERLKGESPRKGSTATGKETMTKEQILNIKDHEMRQQKMLEHKELFNL